MFMKFLYVLFLIAFGFANSAHAAEFIQGHSLTKTLAQGQMHLGSTQPIACAENFEPNTGCFQWTAFDKEMSRQCYRSSLVGLHDNFPEPKQIWVPSWEGKRLFMLNYGFQSKKEPDSKTIEVNKDGHYPIVYGDKIDCESSRQNNPLIFEEISSSVLNALPFSSDIKIAIRSDCLLAEKALRFGGLFNGPAIRQFYCLETETIGEADAIAKSYIAALELGGSETKKEHERYYPKWNWSSGQIDQNQLAFTGMAAASVRVAAVSSENVTAFYDQIGTNTEITKGRAAALFAIDVIFEDHSDQSNTTP